MHSQKRNKIWGLQECLEHNKTILRLQQRFRGDLHNIFWEKIDRIALKGNGDDRIWADGVTTHPCGYEF